MKEKICIVVHLVKESDLKRDETHPFCIPPLSTLDSGWFQPQNLDIDQIGRAMEAALNTVVDHNLPH